MRQTIGTFPAATFLAATFLATTFLAAITLAASSQEQTVGQLVTLEGARDNQLVGYGLVVGLNGTGDKRQTVFSTQSLASMLDRLGVQVNPQSLLVRNIAAVIVTANLGPYSGQGTKLDVNVAAIGDAQNLQGGILIQTPLRGANGTIYAVAQGAVVTGGFVAGGRGNQLSTNHPTVGRVVAGALVEVESPSLPPQSRLRLHLNQADFSASARISEAINERFRQKDAALVAKAIHGGLVEVQVPPSYAERGTEFFAAVEELTVKINRRSRIVINERTGTILIGKDVRLRPVSIMHGALSVEVSSSPVISQPAPLSGGETVVVQQPTVKAKEEVVKSITLREDSTVDDLVQALRQIGSSARDVIAILQTLKSARAIDADIEVL